MLTARVKFYLILAGVVVLALLGWRQAGVRRALEAAEARINANRLKAIQDRRKADMEAANAPDTYLIDMLSR